MARREYGEGSVYHRASDNRWVGTIEAGWNEKGKRRRVHVTGKTEAVVRRKLRDKRRELEQGTATTSSRTTIKSWSEQWLEHTQHELAPKTWSNNASAVRRWIVPTIGHRRITEVSAADVRAVAGAIRKAGRQSSTVVRAHSVLSSLLTAAQVEGHQVPAAALAVKPPGKPPSGRGDIPVDEALLMLELASRLLHGSRWAMAFLQGMRPSECRGLTWSAIDLDNERLILSWQMQALPYVVPRDRSSGFRVPDDHEAIHLENALHLVRPKSKAGWRVLPLIPWMTDALRAWKEIAPANPHDLVWPALTGRPCSPEQDVEEWRALQCTVGVGHKSGRYYDLYETRHTTATLLLSLGVPESVRIMIMGHSSIASTRVYEHVDTAAVRAALEQVGQRLQLER